MSWRDAANKRPNDAPTEEEAGGWLAERRLPLSAAGAAGASQGKGQQRAGKGKGKQPPKQVAAVAACSASADGGKISREGRESAAGETLRQQRPPRAFTWRQFQS
jgi:hypothetical protein